MIHLNVRKPKINPDRLHADLALALGPIFLGLSFSGDTLTLHLDGKATPDQQAQALQITADHDPAGLTPAQEAARARDALPFFRLPIEALVTDAARLDAATFQQEMARAFAYLRDLVVGQ